MAARHALLARPQQAEPGLELRLERRFARIERITADAQKGEIVGHQPFEEGNRLGHFLARQRRRAFL
jgi:hypothetical protein